jgi:hypothetical protein
MATTDWGLFKALTGPMQASNTIQQGRDAEKLQQLQLQEQQYRLQLAEEERQNTLRSQLDAVTKAAHDAIYKNNNQFRRDKDATDYSKWHQEYSGWSDIEQILKQYNNIPNARMHGKLDEALAVYKQRVQTASQDPTKGNPVLYRAQQNFKALEQYKNYALDKNGNAKFLTSNSHRRFQDWQDGETDYFIYTGVRGDYLDQVSKASNKADRIDLEDIMRDHRVAITNDMVRDLGIPANSISDQDMRNWLAQELQYDPATKRFGDDAIYGEQEIETDYATELVRGIEATNKIGALTGGNILDLMDKGASFKDIFDSEMSMTWDRLGGYDKNSSMHSTMKSPVSKGLQVIGSARLLGNDRNLETAITNSWAGTFDDGKTPRYNSKDRQVYGVEMKGLYDRRGHRITDQDIASTWLGGKDLWQESETDNLRLTGYHIALEGKNADGDSFLLTNVKSKKDMAKLKEQYKNVQFSPVMVAELIDDDLGPDDVYYHKIDMSQISIRSAINKNIDPKELNQTLNQMADYEQESARSAYEAKQRMAREAVLVKQLNLPDNAKLDEVVSAYDQSLTIGLGTAGIRSGRIQEAIPMIIADLYVASQQQKEFPVVIEKDAQGRPTKQANDSYELMAYRAQQLKMGLIKGMPGFEAMLEAIKTGNYDAYRKQTMDSKTYSASKKISKGISQYYNNR